jgi:hypothetical protein
MSFCIICRLNGRDFEPIPYEGSETEAMEEAESLAAKRKADSARVIRVSNSAEVGSIRLTEQGEYLPDYPDR